MNFSLSLTSDQINTVLRLLDQGPHAQVRQIIDTILQQVGEQQRLQTAKAEPEVHP